MKRTSTVIGAGTAAVVLAGMLSCASWGADQKKGTTTVAAGGGIIGHKTGSTARGAIIGAVVGGTSGVLFPFDSAAPTSEARANLRTLAATLQAEPRTEVMIVGHTDSAGSDDYNQRLSERRGHSAEDYLSSLGVAASRLASDGRGEAEPVASNDTEGGRRENRRVEVAIYASGAGATRRPGPPACADTGGRLEVRRHANPGFCQRRGQAWADIDPT